MQKKNIEKKKNEKRKIQEKSNNDNKDLYVYPFLLGKTYFVRKQLGTTYFIPLHLY